VRYPKKGLIVLDLLTITIKEDILGPGVVYSTTEGIYTGIVKIPNTYIEVIKSDFLDY
jgi:hypothetical protein